MCNEHCVCANLDFSHLLNEKLISEETKTETISNKVKHEHNYHRIRSWRENNVQISKARLRRVYLFISVEIICVFRTEWLFWTPMSDYEQTIRNM